MRKWIYSTAAALAAFCCLSTGSANALPADRLAVPSAVEQTQFIFGGRNYCWYDAGWHGPGFYWCGYAMRRGFGWGGGAGWPAGITGQDVPISGVPVARRCAQAVLADVQVDTEAVAPAEAAVAVIVTDHWS